MKTIRWGIIGCGDVTEVKSGPGFYKAANSQLVAVMRRDGALAADYARRHGVPRWHDDAEAIIRAPDIDAVYVATFPNSHHDYVLRCAAAGKPVLVEKPMAIDLGQCDDMIAACAAAGVAAVGRLLSARAAAFPQGARSGAERCDRRRAHGDEPPVPDVARPDGASPASSFWRIDTALSGGGYFVDMVSHTLDFLDFRSGPSKRCVRSRTTRPAPIVPRTW